MGKWFLGILALVLVVGLVGCPQQLPILPGDNGENTNLNAETGGFSVSGDLYDNDAKSGEDLIKSDGGDVLTNIGDTFKRKAAFISFCLYPVNGGPDSSYFQLPVVNGHFEGQCYGILPGEYAIDVSITDTNYYALFSGHTSVVIEANKVASISVTMDLLSSYNFNFSIKNFPGEYFYRIDTKVKIITNEGRIQETTWFVTAEDNVMFNCFLPLGCNGFSIIIEDIKGNKYSSYVPLKVWELDWEKFQFGDVLEYDYMPSTRLGSVDVEIVFNYDY